MCKKLLCLISLVLVLALISAAQAATPIGVSNFSFEYYEDGSQILGHMIFGPWRPGSLLGWTGTKDWVGVDVECRSNTATPEHCHNFYATDGIAYLYMHNVDTEVYQVLEHNIVGGRQYTLTFDTLTAMGDSPTGFDHFPADEIIPSFFYVDDGGNHVELASEMISLQLIDRPLEECGCESTIIPGTCWGWMYDLTLSFTTQCGAEYIGKPLGIKFTAPFPVPAVPNDWAWSFVDNVRVDMGAYEATTVTIDIKPGSYPNAINLGSYGLVPVAILSSELFDATTVDPETVELAGAGIAIRGKSNKYMAHKEDVNGDGLTDLVVQVATENLDPSSLQDGYAILTGSTYVGQNIKGKDEITIVPLEK